MGDLSVEMRLGVDFDFAAKRLRGLGLNRSAVSNCLCVK